MLDKKPRSPNEKQLTPGEMLFKEGDSGEVMYFIRKGKIKISIGHDDQEKVLAILKDGDFFGEMAVLDGSPRNADATAIEETDLIIIDKESFLSKVNENPLIAYTIEELTKRIRILDERLKYVTIASSEERIISYVLSQGKSKGVATDDGGVRLENETADHIAFITGVQGQKVVEYLGRLQEVGLIVVDTDQIKINRIPDLEEYIRYLKLRDKFKS